MRRSILHLRQFTWDLEKVSLQTDLYIQILYEMDTWIMYDYTINWYGYISLHKNLMKKVLERLLRR